MSDHENNIPWGVVYTRPYKELLATSLLDQTIRPEVYLLEVMRERPGVRRPAPRFSGYFFIRSGPVGDHPHQPHAGRHLNPDLAGRSPDYLSHYRQDPAPADGRHQRSGGLVAHPYHTGDRMRLIGGPLEGLDNEHINPQIQGISEDASFGEVAL